MHMDLAKLNERTKEFCTNPSSLFQGEGRTLLTELLRAFCCEGNLSERNKLGQLLSIVRRAADTNLSSYAHVLHTIALDEYKSGNVDFAEYLFRSAYDLSDGDTFNNNLAYVLRRERDGWANSCEIMTLLLPGVQKKAPFCLINMGLLFALKMSTPKDWETADELFSLLPAGLSGADSWWEKLGKNGDSEGYLVHFFLLRHGKIRQSSLGSIKSIVQHLKRNLKEFPEHFAREYALQTLEDVIQCREDADFDEILEDFLDKMPHSRESVDEMLKILSDWDLWPVYYKLLTDCTAALTPDETARLKAAYAEKFLIPLPDEDE